MRRLTPEPGTRLVHLGGLLAALTLMGFTCVNQDYAEVQEFVIEGKFGTSVSSDAYAPYAGRLSVDYVVVASNDAPLDIELTATTLQAELVSDVGDVTGGGGDDVGSADVGGDEDAGGTPEPDTSGSASIRIQLQRGQRKVGRFDAQDLRSGVGVEVAAYCLATPCLGTVEYSLLIGQHECRSNADCTSETICDLGLGRCTPRPCADNSACQEGQVCDVDLGSCVAEGFSCATPPPSAPNPPWSALLLAGALCAAAAALLLARRRAASALLPALLALWLTLDADQAQAQTAFDRPSASVGVNTGVALFTGELSDVSGTGLTIEYHQALQYRYLALTAGIGTSYFLTFQEPPPIARGAQFYTLRLSPTFVYPWRSFRFALMAEYQRVGVISNALVDLTGPELEFNAAGGAFEARWNLSPLTLGVRVGYAQFFEFTAGLLSISLDVSLETSI